MRAFLISLLKKNPYLLNSVAFIYNLLHNRHFLLYALKKNVSCNGVFLKGCKIEVSDKTSSIIIDPMVVLSNCCITSRGKNNHLEILSGGTVLKNTSIHLLDDCSTIHIGRKVTTEGAWIMSTEGNHIDIGDDCMISDQVAINNGDFHPIYDDKMPDVPINLGQSVYIGAHVWICSNTRILKGAVIPQGSVIGNSSLVNKNLDSDKTIYAGVPAKAIKHNVYWKREHALLINQK